MAFIYTGKKGDAMKFICGVHGAGKTFFAKKMSQENSINYYSASELIKKETESQISNYKKVQRILDNQVLLLEALSKIKDIQYILDGHLCLLNKENKIEKIPYKFFEKMNIDIIYIIVELPIEIQHRLKNRDDQMWDIGLIALFQQEELKYAKKLSEKMNIPLKIIYKDREIIDCSFLEEKNIVLPIKPIFANKILSGEKKYEYRKKLCKKNVKKIYIYSTAPTKMIIGEANIIDKLRMDKENLWEQTQLHSGICKEFYNKYFEKQKYACAYEIGEVKRYSTPITLKSIGINYVPQSYIYISELNLF